MSISFATAFIALYVGHHVGDYWIQTGHQAGNKGKAGHAGRVACSKHVFSYILTQAACLAMAYGVTGEKAGYGAWVLALVVSGVTHYMADRREHGFMLWIAKKAGRYGIVEHAGVVRPGGGEDRHGLASGGWALDQSWHIALGVFLPALLLAGLS